MDFTLPHFVLKKCATMNLVSSRKCRKEWGKSRFVLKIVFKVRKTVPEHVSYDHRVSVSYCIRFIQSAVSVLFCAQLGLLLVHMVQSYF